jgi:hypothetical protein
MAPVYPTRQADGSGKGAFRADSSRLEPGFASEEEVHVDDVATFKIP